MSSTTSSTPLTRRPGWLRRLREGIVQQLTQGTTPDKIALTFAVGTALGLFPIFGTTTLLCLAAAWLLRLNQPLIHTLNQALWPIHVAMLVPFVQLGDWLVDAHDGPVDLGRMNYLLWHEPRAFLHEFGEVVLHSLIGWAVMAPLIGLGLYLVLRPLVRRVAARVKPNAS